MLFIVSKVNSDQSNNTFSILILKKYPETSSKAKASPYSQSSPLEDCCEDSPGSGMMLARVCSTEPPDLSAPEMPRLLIESFAWRSAIRSPPIGFEACGNMNIAILPIYLCLMGVEQPIK